MGAGKDSILRELVSQDGFTSLVSHTTRFPRIGEINGREYYFVNKQQFDKLEMVETREYHTFNNLGQADTWFYGLSLEELKNKMKYNSIPIVILDIDGLIHFDNYCRKHDIEVISFYIKVNPLVRLYRVIKRGSFTWREVFRRLADDKRKFKSAQEICTYTVENKDLKKAVKDIKHYLKFEERWMKDGK